MANYNQNAVYNGLGTFIIATVPTTDNYTIQGKLDLPAISKGDSANSAVVVVVKKDSTTIYTSAAGASGFSVNASLTAAQSISIVLSSAAAVDQGLNVIKTKVSISEGVQ